LRRQNLQLFKYNKQQPKLHKIHPDGGYFCFYLSAPYIQKLKKTCLHVAKWIKNTILRRNSKAYGYLGEFN
jgi:hypothetical protein